jgi:hypothetical protein
MECKMEMPTVPSKRNNYHALIKSAWEILRRNPVYIAEFKKHRRDWAREIRDQAPVQSRFPKLARVRRPVVDGVTGRFVINHGIIPIDPAKPFKNFTAFEREAFSLKFGQQDVVDVPLDPDLEDFIQKKVDNVSLDPWSTKLLVVLDSRTKESVLMKKIRNLIREKRKSLGFQTFRFRPQDISIQMAVWTQKKAGASNQRIARNIKLNSDLDYKSRNDRIKDLARAARNKIAESHRILDEARSEIT